MNLYEIAREIRSHFSLATIGSIILAILAIAYCFLISGLEEEKDEDDNSIWL